MLKRYWLLIAAIIGGLTIVIALIHGKANEPQCNDVLAELPSNPVLAPKQDVSGQTNSVTCQADCQVSFSGGDKANIPSGADHNKANTQCDTPEELDLVAQKQMAHWTAYIAGLTGVGLALLAGTLLEAFRATDAAQQVIKGDRAWLCYFDTEDQSFSGNFFGNDVQNSRTFAVKWKNVGRSPAINVRVFRSLKEIPFDTVEFEPASIEIVDVQSGAVIGPEIFAVTEWHPITTETMNRLLTRQSKLVMYSRIIYNDIFEKTEERFSEATIVIDYYGTATDIKTGQSSPVFAKMTTGPKQKAT